MMSGPMIPIELALTTMEHCCSPACFLPATASCLLREYQIWHDAARLHSRGDSDCLYTAYHSQGRSRSRFVASRKLPPQVAGPFWAALASQERRLPARLASAVLTLFPATAERALAARARADSAALRQVSWLPSAPAVAGLVGHASAALQPSPFLRGVMNVVPS